MYPHRRARRALALMCTVAAVAGIPAGAAAMPAPEAPEARTVAAPAVEAETGGDGQTLALVVSGAALLVALGGAGYAGRIGQRVGQPSH
jgi:hypothetical protein